MLSIKSIKLPSIHADFFLLCSCQVSSHSEYFIIIYVSLKSQVGGKTPISDHRGTSYYGLKGTPTYCIVFAVLCCLIQALYTFLWPIQCYEHWWYVGLHTFKQEHLKEQDIWPSLILCAFLLIFEFKSLNWQQCHWVDCEIYWEYRTASQLSWPFSLRANNKFASALITVICFNCSRN